MTTPRGIARRPGPAVRRGTAWEDHFVTIEIANGGSINEDLLTNTTDSERRGYTLVRQILRLDLVADVPGGVSGKQQVSLGIGLASDDAFAAGALPEPEAGVDFPVTGWLWRSQYIVIDELLINGLVAPIRIDEDLHAARKLDRSTLYIRAHSTVEQGTAFQVALTGLIRSLYKLP